MSLQNWSLRIPLHKVDAVQGIATGWAAISTDDTWEPVIDHDGEYIPIAELEKAAHHAFLTYGPHGRIGDMHRRTGVADLIESLVLDREKRKALGFGEPPSGHPAEGWIVSLKLRDPKALAEVAAGDKPELSIRGTAERVPLNEWESAKRQVSKSQRKPHVLVNLVLNEAELLSVVDKGASGNARVSPKIVLVKRRTGIMGLLSKWFKNGKVKAVEKRKDCLAELKKQLADLEDDARNGVLAAYSQVVLKLEGDVQAMLEAALAGLPDDKVAAIMAAFQMAVQSPAPPAPAPEAPKMDPEPKPEEKADGEMPAEEEDETAKVLKSMDPAGRKLLEKVLKSNRDLEKRLDTETTKRRERESIEKANQTPHVPGELDERAKLLAEADESLSEESRETLNKILTGSNALIAKSLEELGTTGAGGPSAGSAEAKAHEMAKARLADVRKSGDRKRTFEQVLDEIWEENPDLYKQYVQEQEKAA